MLQVGGGLDLGEEPLGADHGGELGAQHLDRDLAIVLEVVREVHGGHAARAELALDAVPVGEGGGKPRDGVAHGVASLLSATRCRNSVIQFGEMTSSKSSESDSTARTRVPSRVTS